ncbi:uncharacterized protein LOC135395060 isoform X2 [Ornithodoros turicata]|uniref:uncharacterized protein LOC135395060 isoform X2 n=1 Tax=Ornithodoros turicata TaxID=34597 RepID=UPI003138B540
MPTQKESKETKPEKAETKASKSDGPKKGATTAEGKSAEESPKKETPGKHIEALKASDKSKSSDASKVTLGKRRKSLSDSSKLTSPDQKTTGTPKDADTTKVTEGAKEDTANAPGPFKTEEQPKKIETPGNDGEQPEDPTKTSNKASERGPEQKAIEDGEERTATKEPTLTTKTIQDAESSKLKNSFVGGIDVGKEDKQTEDDAAPPTTELNQRRRCSDSKQGTTPADGGQQSPKGNGQEMDTKSQTRRVSVSAPRYKNMASPTPSGSTSPLIEEAVIHAIADEVVHLLRENSAFCSPTRPTKAPTQPETAPSTSPSLTSKVRRKWNSLLSSTLGLRSSTRETPLQELGTPAYEDALDSLDGMEFGEREYYYDARRQSAGGGLELAAGTPPPEGSQSPLVLVTAPQSPMEDTRQRPRLEITQVRDQPTPHFADETTYYTPSPPYFDAPEYPTPRAGPRSTSRFDISRGRPEYLSWRRSPVAPLEQEPYTPYATPPLTPARTKHFSTTRDAETWTTKSIAEHERRPFTFQRILRDRAFHLGYVPRVPQQIATETLAIPRWSEPYDRGIPPAAYQAGTSREIVSNVTGHPSARFQWLAPEAGLTRPPYQLPEEHRQVNGTALGTLSDSCTSERAFMIMNGNYDILREESSLVSTTAGQPERAPSKLRTRDSISTESQTAAKRLRFAVTIAENLRSASRVVQQLNYDSKEEQLRRDLVAADLLRRAALASMDAREASRALMEASPDFEEECSDEYVTAMESFSDQCPSRTFSIQWKDPLRTSSVPLKDSSASIPEYDEKKQLIAFALCASADTKTTRWRGKRQENRLPLPGACKTCGRLPPSNVVTLEDVEKSEDVAGTWCSDCLETTFWKPRVNASPKLEPVKTMQFTSEEGEKVEPDAAKENTRDKLKGSIGEQENVQADVVEEISKGAGEKRPSDGCAATIVQERLASPEAPGPLPNVSDTVDTKGAGEKKTPSDGSAATIVEERLASPKAPVPDVPETVETKGEDTQEVFPVSESPEVIYPESKFVAIVSVCCLLWILLLSLTSFVGHRVSGGARNLITHSDLFSHDNNISLTTTSPGTETSSQTKIYSFLCGTKSCTRQADYLKSILSGDPCVDFYDYVCGKVIRKWEEVGWVSLSSDVMIASRLEDKALKYLRDPANTDAEVARQLLNECESSTGVTKEEILDVVKSYVNWDTWLIEDRVLNISAWRIAAALAMELGIQVLLETSHGTGRKLIIAGPPRHRFFDSDKKIIFNAARIVTGSLLGVGYGRALRVSRNIVDVSQNISNSLASKRKQHPRLLPLGKIHPGIRTLVCIIYSDDIPTAALFSEYIDDVTQLVDSRPEAVVDYLLFWLLLFFAPYLGVSELGKLFPRTLSSLPLHPDRHCTRAVERSLPVAFMRALSASLGSMTSVRHWVTQVEALQFTATRPRAYRHTRPKCIAEQHPLCFSHGTICRTHLPRSHEASATQQHRWIEQRFDNHHSSSLSVHVYALGWSLSFGAHGGRHPCPHCVPGPAPPEACLGIGLPAQRVGEYFLRSVVLHAFCSGQL